MLNALNIDELNIIVIKVIVIIQIIVTITQIIITTSGSARILRKVLDISG